MDLKKDLFALHLYSPVQVTKIFASVAEGQFGCSLSGRIQIKKLNIVQERDALIKVQKFETKDAEKDFLLEVQLQSEAWKANPNQIPQIYGIWEAKLSSLFPFIQTKIGVKKEKKEARSKDNQQNIQELLSPNCVQKYKIWKDEKATFWFIAMEKAKFGSLYNLLFSLGNGEMNPQSFFLLNKKNTCCLFQQLFHALVSLNASLGFHHMDLKPENIVFQTNTTTKATELCSTLKKRLLLIDFGAAVAEKKSLGNVLFRQRDSSYIGPDSVLLEVNPRTVSPLIDVYSFGLCLLETASTLAKYTSSKTTSKEIFLTFHFIKSKLTFTQWASKVLLFFESPRVNALVSSGKKFFQELKEERKRQNKKTETIVDESEDESEEDEEIDEDQEEEEEEEEKTEMLQLLGFDLISRFCQIPDPFDKKNPSLSLTKKHRKEEPTKTKPWTDLGLFYQTKEYQKVRSQIFSNNALQVCIRKNRERIFSYLGKEGWNFLQKVLAISPVLEFKETQLKYFQDLERHPFLLVKKHTKT